MSKSKQSDNKTNEQFISDLRSLFEVTSSRHKQDKDFLKKFTSLIKKEKLSDKKNVINEIQNLFKQASNSKSLYFNTIVDALLLLQAKEINIVTLLAEAIKGPCQIDKKSKENIDNEEIKLFCFQKLEIQHAESQINLSKVLVFMERVLKQISTLKSKEEVRNMLQFLQSIQEILSLQLQLQSLICILILKIIFALKKESTIPKSDMKVLYSMIDEQTIQMVFKSILTIAKTTYTHCYYHYIFKSCFILLFEFSIKNKISIAFQTLLSGQQCQNQFLSIVNTVKEFNFNFFSEHKELPFLFEKPRFVIDYLPTNFILGILNKNPSNWICVQSFIQNHQQIDDKYLNFTIANLAQRQSKLIDLSLIFQNNKLKKKNIQIDQLLSDSILQSQDVGTYNTYIFCQLHLLVYLNSFDMTNHYFSKTKIDCDSRFFKRLLLLRLDEKIYKYQEITQLQKPRLGINQYFTYQINKLLKQLSHPINQNQIKKIYSDLKQMLNLNYHFQCPFITKFSSYIKVLFKDLLNLFLNESLYAFDYQQYYGLIIILSCYSKQAFQAFILSILTGILKLKKQSKAQRDLTQFQLSALEEVGVMFKEMNIEDPLLQQMIFSSIQFFTTFEIRKNQNLNQFIQILEKLKIYIRSNTNSYENVLKQYKSLMLISIDKFLMLNGLQAQSLKCNQSKFNTFFHNNLEDSLDFIEVLTIITSHIRPQEVSKYLEYLAECYLASLQNNTQNKQEKFKLCAQIKCFNIFRIKYEKSKLTLSIIIQLSQREKIKIGINKFRIQWTIFKQKKINITVFEGELVFQDALQLFIEIIKMKKKQKQICWICYQKNSHKRFKPCNCKGSLSYIHKKCLNQWATKQYNQNNQIIRCPNCKFEYIFTVKECYKVTKTVYSSQEIFQIGSFAIQQRKYLIIISGLDFISVSDYLQVDENEKQEVTMFKWINIIHFGNVLMIICSATFNIMQMAVTKIELEILDMRN